MIIALSGYVSSGKDTLGKYLQHHGQELSDTSIGMPTWEIKKFAAKLKQIAAILTGYRESDFEDQEFKKTFLGPEWDQYLVTWDRSDDGPGSASFKTEQEAIDYMNESFEDGYEEDRVSFHKMTIREFLQKLGTEAIRENIHTNAWVNALFARYEPLADKWIITDCRFPNEAQAVKDRGGIVIRINRGEQPTEEQRSKLHPSETSLDNWNFDFVVDNNGDLEALEQVAKEILAKITVL